MSNGELLEGFKQGSGMNCCLLFKNHSGCCVENELWGSKYGTGKPARRLCYNPDEMAGSWMRVVTLEMERSGWLWETYCYGPYWRPRQGHGRGEKKVLMYRLALSLVLDISPFRGFMSVLKEDRRHVSWVS